MRASEAAEHSRGAERPFAARVLFLAGVLVVDRPQRRDDGVTTAWRLR
jgi:hypothetical protein